MRNPYETPTTRDDSDWMTYANCATSDPEAFTPPKGGTNQPAKQVCAACDVRTQCLEWALATNQLKSVYGGLSPRERRKLRQEAA